MTISYTTGGVAAHSEPAAADFEELQNSVLEMHSESIPRSIPFHNTFRSRVQTHDPRSFFPDSSSYNPNYVIASGEQSFAIDPRQSQSVDSILSANRSSSTEPWNPLDVTGVSGTRSSAHKGSSASELAQATSAGHIDNRSDSFRDSGLGTLLEQSQYDTSSQLSSPLTDMAYPQGQWPMLPSQPQPQEVNYQGDEAIEVEDDDDIEQNSPDERRSGPRRGTGKADEFPCAQCDHIAKTPSDLK